MFGQGYNGCNHNIHLINFITWSPYTNKNVTDVMFWLVASHVTEVYLPPKVSTAWYDPNFFSVQVFSVNRVIRSPLPLICLWCSQAEHPDSPEEHTTTAVCLKYSEGQKRENFREKRNSVCVCPVPKCTSDPEPNVTSSIAKAAGCQPDRGTWPINESARTNQGQQMGKKWTERRKTRFGATDSPWLSDTPAESERQFLSVWTSP